MTGDLEITARHGGRAGVRIASISRAAMVLGVLTELWMNEHSVTVMVRQP